VVSQITIYFEGHRGLARPLQVFLERGAPGLKGKVRAFYGKGRNDTIHDFLRAKSQHPNLTHVLLLDSDEEDDGRLFQRLQGQEYWQVRADSVIGEERVCWMVHLMESWFLADRDALREYYGSGLHENSLPRNREVERVPKADVLDGLKRATRNTGKGAYRKGAHAPRILEKLDPTRVRTAASHCDRFLRILAQVVLG
jgi:hypothetical protein